jgi:hypothetical protein
MRSSGKIHTYFFQKDILEVFFFKIHTFCIVDTRTYYFILVHIDFFWYKLYISLVSESYLSISEILKITLTCFIIYFARLGQILFLSDNLSKFDKLMFTPPSHLTLYFKIFHINILNIKLNYVCVDMFIDFLFIHFGADGAFSISLLIIVFHNKY